MTTSIIPQDYSVVKDGVAFSDSNSWTFNDSDIHAIQWDHVSQTGNIELENGESTPVSDYDTEVLPYENWHAQQASLLYIDERFYTVGPISGNAYTKIERDLDTCKQEQVDVQYVEASQKLSATDPYLIRESELGSVPGEVDQYRIDIRQVRDDRIAAINAASDISSLETLVNGFDVYLVDSRGYINTSTGQRGITQQTATGTHAWPRIAYTLLRSL